MSPDDNPLMVVVKTLVQQHHDLVQLVMILTSAPHRLHGPTRPQRTRERRSRKAQTPRQIARGGK